MPADTRYVFSTTETIHYRFPTHTNDLVMDRAQAATSEVFIVILEPGEAPPLHVHHDTEQVFYLLQGAGTLQIGDEDPQSLAVKPRDLVRIPPHTPHRIRCAGAEPVVYLSVDCFVGGRPAQEPTWDSHVRAMCAENHWDFDRVKQAGR
jgi:mannose-6-phosphate isomerase-like protein (cupin superfamily)